MTKDELQKMVEEENARTIAYISKLERKVAILQNGWGALIILNTSFLKSGDVQALIQNIDSQLKEVDK